ncbi:MAG: Gx transporter family protein, partial [Gemmiger qucibialis]
RFAVSATGGAHLCSIQYYLRFWLGICRTSLAVSALRIMRYCHKIMEESPLQNYKARQTALLGMLFALSMALSFLESMLTPFFGLMPAMKLGLSNIVVMYAVLFLNRRSALYLVLLKALFALLTRGVTAGFLSLCGGALSLAVFCLLLALPFTITGYIFSVSGALAHNCGQLLGAAALLSDKMAITYAPMLLIAGLIVGSCTYMVSRLIFPAVKRIIPPKSKAESKITF